MELLFAVAVLTTIYFVIKKVRGPLPPSAPRYGGIPYDPNAPKGTNGDFTPGTPLLDSPSDGNWYQALTEQCSGTYPVTYDTSFRVYYGTDCDATSKVRVQMSWTTEGTNEVVGTYDSGYQLATGAGNVNGVYYIENTTPLSIPINATQANLKVHATASLWSGSISSQPTATGHGTISIIYPCN